jgi:enamine deaminase RidA (YjgF/YER057c/UK114 family)
MGRRRSLYLTGFSHANPIPAACRLDHLVASGLINGVDPQTGRPGADFAAQCRFMLGHVRAVMEDAGGTLEDVASMAVWLRDAAMEDGFMSMWQAAFPDARSRPACRIAIGTTAADIQVQCSLLAVLERRGPPQRP